MSGAHTGMLATVRADGRPHIAPIWFILDGDDLVFTTWHFTIKAANLQRDPRVSICVDDDTPPFAFVIVEGVASLSEQMDELAHWTRVIAARYMGAEHAEAFSRRNAVPGEYLVRVRPTKVIAQSDVAGW
jgi:PPOX class probable F420-dependent enzyme